MGIEISEEAIGAIVREFRLFLKRKSNLCLRTINLYAYILKAVFLRLNPFKMTTEIIEDRIKLATDLAPSTKRNYVIVLRLFGKWLQWEGVRDDNPAKAMKLPARGRYKHRDLPQDIIKKIFYACETNRERVIVRLLYYSGARAEELLCLKVSDIDFEHNFLWIQNGKGGKERFVPYVLDPEFKDLLCRYIQEHHVTDWLFPTQRGRMCFWTLNAILKDIGSRINLKFSAHQLRHSIATHLYNNDMDLIALRDFLGHSDVQTTQQYVRVYISTVQRKYNKAMAMEKSS